MRVGYDAKRAFYNNTGLGNYSRGVISCLDEYEKSIEKLFFAPSRKGIIDQDLLRMGTTHYMKGALKNVNRVFNLTKSLKKHNLDIFHGLSNELPLKINRIHLKSVVTIHDIIFMKLPQYYKPIDRKIYYYKTLYATQNADLIITTSNQTKQDLDEVFGCGDKCTTIYQHSTLPITKDLSNPMGKDYLLYVSSFEKRKNHLNLINAFNEAKNEIQHNLVLIGRKKETYPMIENKIKELGLEKRIKIIADATDESISNYLNYASGFIYPSFYEGFGIPMIEAMHANVPIACSKIAVFEELVKDGAIYFDALSVSDIKNAILALSNPQITQKKVIFTENLKTFFLPQTHAKNLSNAYKQIL